MRRAASLPSYGHFSPPRYTQPPPLARTKHPSWCGSPARRNSRLLPTCLHKQRAQLFRFPFTAAALDASAKRRTAGWGEIGNLACPSPDCTSCTRVLQGERRDMHNSKSDSLYCRVRHETCTSSNRTCCTCTAGCAAGCAARHGRKSKAAHLYCRVRGETSKSKAAHLYCRVRAKTCPNQKQPTCTAGWGGVVCCTAGWGGDGVLC